MELKKITEADLQGVGVVGMEDTPNLSALEMQKKVEEVGVFLKNKEESDLEPRKPCAIKNVESF